MITRLCMAAIVALSILLRAAEAKPIKGATPETFFGTVENLEIVKTATSITVYRAFPDGKKKTEGRRFIRIDDCDCLAAPAIVKGPEVAETMAALSDLGNFGEGFVCDFDPGVILRFASGKRTVDLMLCFHCREMIVFSDDALVRRPYGWSTSKNSFHGKASEAFKALAKKAFPDDKEIQAL